MLAAGIVIVLAAVGGYALLTTRAKADGNHSAGQAASGQHRRSKAGSSGGSRAPAAKSAATVSITWVGDMTFGTLNEWPPDGAGSLIDGVKPYLHSDLTVGNLETALGDLPMSKCSPGEADCYQFEAPTYTAKDLKRDGFSAVNVANNHTLDAGPAGEVSTDNALRSAGLLWAGRPGQITYLTRNGIKIALLGFAPWPYDANALDIPAAEALVRQASKHAQVVIVMEHLGGEGDDYRHVRPGEEYFLGQDRGNSIAFTHGVIDAGADLVMGSGPHVLRGFQWYHHHLIAYSLGNFCGYDTLGLDQYTSISAMLHVTLNAEGQFVRGSITPLRLVSPGTPELDPARTAISYVNSLSQEDFVGNGAVHISPVGEIELPST
jgi:poly-gamma-glutamate capsule biosynthesis protein CapA/YwtB (metallophosphatase superfamily)